MTKKVVIILFALVLVGSLGWATISAREKTRPIDMTLNGSIMSISEEVGIFDVNLKGDPGKSNARGMSFTYPVDYNDLPAGNQCVDLGNGAAPDGLIISDGQINIVFEGGAMLFGNSAAGGYVCFAPGYAYAPYELAGGTGRFEGATGTLNFDIETHPFGAPGAPVTPETGTATGEIILP